MIPEAGPAAEQMGICRFANRSHYCRSEVERPKMSSR